MRPILFHIGSLPIRAYGTMVIIGYLLGLWRGMRVAAYRMKTEPEGSPRRIHPDTAFDLALFGLLFGIAGARIVYVLLDWSQYASHPLEVFMVWHGGLSFHGAMLFGLTFLYVYCRVKRVSFLAFADLVAPSWAITYAVGRIGCLLNGCCYGGACSMPWGVRFPDETIPNNNGPHPILTPPSHPIQAYAFLFNIFFFFVLTRWEKRPHRDGELFWGYISMYGAYRLFVEMFRAGVTSTYLIPALHLTDTHIVSILMLFGGIVGVIALRRRPIVAEPLARPSTI